MTEWKAGDRPMTAAEADLIDAVMATYLPLSADVAQCRAAVLAERAPPDPVEVAWKASGKVYADGTHIPTPDWFRATLKAYDAAKEKKS